MLPNKSYLIIPVLFLLVSCAPATKQGMLKKGGKSFNAKQLYSLVSGNTLKLSSVSFDGKILFQQNGKLSAKDVKDNSDTGIWDINQDSELCFKYHAWYHGDTKCYSVMIHEQQLYLFTSNGALEYSGTSLTGDPEQLFTANQKTNKRTFLRQQMADQQAGNSTTSPADSQPSSTVDQPELPQITDSASSSSPRENSIQRMAKNCPGCNLVGADLQKMSLNNANLQGADLQGANLSGARLRRANFKEAILSGAILRGTNLPGANFVDADLRDADFTGANLIKADFTGARMDGIILKNALTESAKGLGK